MWCVSSTVHLHKSGHVNSLMLSWFVEHSMFQKLWHLLIHLFKTWSFNFWFYACFQIVNTVSRFRPWIFWFLSMADGFFAAVVRQTDTRLLSAKESRSSKFQQPALRCLWLSRNSNKRSSTVESSFVLPAGGPSCYMHKFVNSQLKHSSQFRKTTHSKTNIRLFMWLPRWSRYQNQWITNCVVW